MPLLHSFFWNVQDAPEGAGPPDFVYVIIISQFVLFSIFGVAQFIILVRNDGYVAQGSNVVHSLA